MPNAVIGLPWRCCRGLPQGDPLSVGLANSFLAEVLRRPLQEVLQSKTTTQVVAYLDDVSLYAPNRGELQKVANDIVHAMEGVKLKLNYKKCVYMTDQKQPLYLKETKLEAQATTDMLGADMAAKPSEPQARPQQRYDKAE